ncbi:hypothetical protein MLD38_033244 [Melastoma candidum]|uniref:Uncharacterized protein n=1 Tax=Melastoma candidum TaxID=119954 RepID=A0ACB9M868_9MYRT|nr:hypothetical protein MLD38_033244 [Melastoma candidum]
MVDRPPHGPSSSFQVNRDRIPSQGWTHVGGQPVVLFDTSSSATPFSRRLFEATFYVHVFVVAALAVYLTIRGFFSGNARHFPPMKWFPPLFVATGSGVMTALAWHCFIRCSPIRAVKAVFWLSPVMTFATGILFVLIQSASSLGIGIVGIVSSIAQFFYYAWVKTQVNYCAKIVSVSTAESPACTAPATLLAIIAATLYSSLLVSGIGGAMTIGTRWDILFIFIMIVSLIWTLHTIKYMLQTMVANIKYLHFAGGGNIHTCQALGVTLKYLVGSIALGSAMIPVFSFLRGSARGVIFVAAGTDEFLCSFADCYLRVATTLTTYGNQYGFVYLGVYNIGIVQASRDAWELFRRSGIEELIKSDQTSLFCSFAGVTGGAVSALVSGSWMLATHQDHATQAAVYSLVIGYLMVRIGTAWAPASVTAYYIAYGENPQSTHFDATIPSRLEVMNRERELRHRQAGTRESRTSKS